MKEGKKDSELKLSFVSFLIGGIAVSLPEAVWKAVDTAFAFMFKSSEQSSSLSLTSDESQLAKANIHYARYLVRYLPSMAFQFTLYDFLKRKTIELSSKDNDIKYFMCGGMSGFITAFILYFLGYHKILHVRDIVQAQKLKQSGMSNKIIALMKIKRMYAGFMLTGANAFIFRSIYFGLYDLLRSKDSGDPSTYRKILYGLVCPPVATLFSLPFTILRKQKMVSTNGISFFGSKSQKMKIIYRELGEMFTQRGVRSSLSLFVYDQFINLYHFRQKYKQME